MPATSGLVVFDPLPQVVLSGQVAPQDVQEWTSQTPSIMWVCTRIDLYCASDSADAYILLNSFQGEYTVLFANQFTVNDPWVHWEGEIPIMNQETLKASNSGQVPFNVAAYVRPYPIFYSLPAPSSVHPAG